MFDKQCLIVCPGPKSLKYFCQQGLKPWPNDQTLLVQRLRFACRAKCLTFWPNPKTLLLHEAKNVFEPFQKHHATNFVTFFVEQCFWTWPNGQTFVAKQILNVGAAMFDRLARA